MQSHWGFICSRRLFLTFGNLTSISLNNPKKYKNLFEQVFHLPYITGT